MSTTKQLKVYKGLPTLIKSRARGYYDDKTILTFNTDAESQNITMDVYDGLSYDIVSSASGVKVLDFVNTVLPYKWDYSTILSTNRYCFAPVNGGSDVAKYTYNFTVVGSPTINNTTKIVGGFSGSDYLTIDSNPNFQNANSWEFVTKVSVGSTSENQKILVGYGINFGVTNSGYLWLWLYNGSWFVDANVCSASLLSTNPFIKLSFDGTTYSCYISPDGETWTLKYSYNSTSKITPNDYTLKLGNSGSEYWRGTIDLSKTSIIINGDAWWIPEFTSHTEKFYYVNYYKYNNFTKVGSLTVDEDTGLVSGFSLRNCIQLNDLINFRKTWEMNFKIITGSNVTSRQKLNGATDNVDFNFPTVEFSRSGSPQLFMLCISSNGSSWNIADSVVGTYQIQANTTYWIKFGWDGNVYYLDYSLNGETFIRDIEVTSNVHAYNSNHYMGIGNDIYSTASDGQSPFLGTIDLSETYIKVDNSLWWRGATLNRELMPGILSNYTDDGSAVTLNCFANGDTSVVLTPDNNYNGTYLGTVNIQAHTAYNYDPDTGEWTPNV